MPPTRSAEILRQALLALPILIGATAVSAQDLVPQEVEYVPLEELSLETGDDGRVDDQAGRVDDRVGGVEWTPARDELAEPAESGWDLGLVLEMAYDDNIFLSSASPESDLVISVTPRVGFIAGRDDDEAAYLKFAYRPSAVIYIENGDETRLDQRLDLEGAIHGRRSGLRFLGNLNRLGGATPEIGAQVDRTEYAAELRAAWRPREKLALEIATGMAGTDYDDGVFSDSKETYLETALRYAYSPKTELVFAVAGGTIEVDQAMDQDFLRATTQLIWKPREKLSFDLKAGVEHRDYGMDSDTFPVLDGRVVWMPREGTEVFLAGYLREESSAIFAGENIEVAGFEAGVARRFGGYWTARLAAGYETADYKVVSGPGLGGREDGIFFIRPSLEYQLNDRFRFGVFYRYEQNDSNAAAFGYDVNRFGVDAELDF